MSNWWGANRAPRRREGLAEGIRRKHPPVQPQRQRDALRRQALSRFLGFPFGGGGPFGRAK